MPEHSETTPIPLTHESIVRYMEQLTTESGQRIVAVSAERLLVDPDIWIVTTTTEQGVLEVWLVPVTRAATPSCPAR